MSTLSTVERSGVIVSLTIPPGFARDMERLITVLQSEITLAEVAGPDFLPKDVTADA